MRTTLRAIILLLLGLSVMYTYILNIENITQNMGQVVRNLSGGNATLFLVIFVFAKCFDWWWDWMPRYLFFLVLGGLAVAVLVILGRVRSGRRRV